MKVCYNAEADSLTLILREAKILESDELQPGVIVDYGYDGRIVGLEILQASSMVTNVREMQFSVADADESTGAR